MTKEEKRTLLMEHFEIRMGAMDNAPDFTVNDMGFYEDAMTRLMYFAFLEGVRMGEVLAAM